MIRFWPGSLLLSFCLVGCSSSPYEPINQSGPIRAMDSFFSGGRTDRYTPPAGYRPQREPEVWVRRADDQPVASAAETR